MNLRKSCGEESTETTDCWCSKVEDRYQKYESGEINYNRKLTKLRETITYNSLVILATQVCDYKETKPKPIQW